MKILLLFCLTFSANLFAKELNILWWNVGANSYAEDLGDYTTLDETIRNTDFSSYDLIAFGEFIETHFHIPSLLNLKKSFPYQKQIQYSKSSKRSIFILSKTPFKGITQEIDWVDRSMTSSQIAKYREDTKKLYNNSMKSFIRSYNRISIDVSGKIYHFVFFHFNNPWPSLTKVKGKYLTAAEILLGFKNPLMHQIENFKNALVNDLGSNYKQKKLILMGDSNCPYSVKGLRSACIIRMKKYLPLILDHAKEFTFPAPTYRHSSAHPKVKIDHAFASDSIDKKVLEVLQWEGSDHLPLHLTIKN